MTRSNRLALGIALYFCTFGISQIAHAGPKFSDWETVTNERHGFAIAYPRGVFEQRTPPTTDQGRVLESKDGRAKLLVGAFENSDNDTLEQYRKFLIDEHYSGADIDYAPIRRRWFVLSGTHNGQSFYQRVSFTCGGKLITSWAMLYPASEGKIYDRVVEAVARTYSPGAGRSGNCD